MKQTIKHIDKTLLLRLLNKALSNKTINDFECIYKHIHLLEIADSVKVMCEVYNDCVTFSFATSNHCISVSYLQDNNIILTSGILESFEVIKIYNCDYNIQYGDVINIIDKID